MIAKLGTDSCEFSNSPSPPERTQTVRNNAQDIHYSACIQNMSLDVPTEEILQKPKSCKLLLKIVDNKKNEPRTRDYAFICQKQSTSPRRAADLSILEALPSFHLV